MSLSYIRKQFAVPAHRGCRVVVDGRRAVITGASGDTLLVRFDGETRSLRRHPIDGVVYGAREKRAVLWRLVTPDQPPPLADVLVSTLVPDEDEPVIFHGWRRATNPAEFLIAGSETDLVPGVVYAFAPEPVAAPLPAEMRRICA